jgi:hypothetical protein
MKAEDNAPDQIFHACFKRRQAAALKARQHVKRHGDEFDGDEQQREIIGRRREHHPRQREDDQAVILRHARFDAVREGHRHDQHQGRGDEKEPLEEQSESIQHVTRAERELRLRRLEVEAVNKDKHQGAGGDQAERPLLLRGQPEVRQQQPQPQRHHENLQNHQRGVHSTPGRKFPP